MVNASGDIVANVLFDDLQSVLPVREWVQSWFLFRLEGAQRENVEHDGRLVLRAFRGLCPDSNPKGLVISEQFGYL